MSGYIGSPETGYLYEPGGGPTGDYSGSTIPDQAVSIGDVILADWEIPEKVLWGGAQRMTVHKMVGGTRQIDVMGPDNAEVSWEARFLSQDAAFRADQIDMLRKSGQLIDLVFGGRYYSAVINSFLATQRTQFWFDYSISFTILVDESSVTAPADPPAIVVVTADMNAVVAMPYVAPQLIAAQVAVAAIPPVLQTMASIQIGAAATTAVAASIGAAATLVSTAQATAEAQIGAIAAAEVTTATLAGATTVVSAINQMNAAAASTYALASSVAMAGYVNRAATNVALQA